MGRNEGDSGGRKLGIIELSMNRNHTSPINTIILFVEASRKITLKLHVSNSNLYPEFF